MYLEANLFVSDAEYNATPANWNANTFPSGARRALARATWGTNTRSTIRSFSQYKGALTADALKNYNITTPPVVVFLDLDTNEAKGVLKGIDITENNIKAMDARIRNKTKGGAQGGSADGEDKGTPSDGGNLPFGIPGLFLGFPGDKDPNNLPSMLMVLTTIGFTKALDENTPTKYRLAYGAGAGLMTYFITQRFKTILLGKGKEPSWNPFANFVTIAKNLYAIDNYHSLWLIPAAFAGTKAFTKETPKALKPVLAAASAVTASVYVGKTIQKQKTISGVRRRTRLLPLK